MFNLIQGGVKTIILILQRCPQHELKRENSEQLAEIYDVTKE